MSYSVFSGFDHIASGSLPETYAACRHVPDALIFDSQTGRVVDIDPRFPPSDEGPRPGRPRLGVTAREITLLPRHWDWLATQPGGASVTLRKLVEEASRNPKAQQRSRRDAAYRSPLPSSAMPPVTKKPCGRCMRATPRSSPPISRPGRRTCAASLRR